MKGLIAVVMAVAAAVVTPSALAGNDHRTLGPAGYDTPGKSALILAGSGGVELGSGDHVVICHAIGGAKGDRFNQIAPSASGVVHGHDGHEGDRDIIPPYTYVDPKGNKDTSLASGNNWAGANIALYNQGCAQERRPDGPPEQPKDECPNIPGNQHSVPPGLVKDTSGNCVQPHQEPHDVCPNLEGVQSSVPAGFVKDATGKCVCPPTTVTVNTVPQAVPQTVTLAAPMPVASVVDRSVVQTSKAKKQPKKKKVKKVKVKRKKVKGKKASKKAKKAKAARRPRVLPFTP